jgi:hypothetical protein
MGSESLRIGRSTFRTSDRSNAEHEPEGEKVEQTDLDAILV